MTINTDVNYEQMFLDMLWAALFPPAPAPYTTFPTSAYQARTASMVKGSTRLSYMASEEVFPLIGGEILTVTRSYFATGIVELRGRFKVLMAHFHPDPDTRNRAAMRDLGLLAEVLGGQCDHLALPSGPFYVNDPLVVTGRGSKTILEVDVPQPFPAPIVRDAAANRGLVTWAEQQGDITVQMAA